MPTCACRLCCRVYLLGGAAASGGAANTRAVLTSAELDFVDGSTTIFVDAEPLPCHIFRTAPACELITSNRQPNLNTSDNYDIIFRAIHIAIFAEPHFRRRATFSRRPEHARMFPNLLVKTFTYLDDTSLPSGRGTEVKLLRSKQTSSYPHSCAGFG